MWFKNVFVFQISNNYSINVEALSDQLSEKSFKPCSDFTPMSLGWVSPVTGDTEQFSFGSMGLVMVCLQQEEKIIPNQVVNQLLADKVQVIVDREGRKPSSRERMTMKDEIYDALLPKALSKRSQTRAYFDFEKQWLIVDCASRNKVEAFLDVLRQSIPDVELILPDVDGIENMMTRWLMGRELPSELVIEDSCVLIDPAQEGATTRCNKQDLSSANVQSFLHDGCRATQLAMSWMEQLRFTLKGDFSFTGLKFLQSSDDMGDTSAEVDEATRFSADFMIMSQGLREMLGFMFGLFAVEETDGKAAEATPVVESEEATVGS